MAKWVVLFVAILYCANFLKEHFDKIHGADNDHLRAEIDRLRENIDCLRQALIAIEKHPGSDLEVKYIAREALGMPKEPSY